MNQDTKDKIITIPNILSTIRIILIPLFIWLYAIQQNYPAAAAVLLISGITDIVDGYIARTFQLISNLGKILDPVADKLTQAATLFCLVTRFPAMLIVLILLIIKELFVGITGWMVFRKTKEVFGANWHGKVATCLLYAMMILHVLWHDIPLSYSDVIIAVCVIMMGISLVLYGIRNINALQKASTPAK